MTVAELRKALEGLPDFLLIGTCDQDDVTCEVQVAQEVSDAGSGKSFFLIRANGGFPLFPDYGP
jgi:hypothetical protein